MRKLLGWLSCAALLILAELSACGTDEAANPSNDKDASTAQDSGSRKDSGPTDPANDWPMYGHDLSGTRASADQTFTVGNVKTLVRKWERWLPTCTSTPAVVAGAVYVGDWFGYVHAYDAKNGAEIWSKKISSSAIDDSPAIAEGMIVVGDGVGALYALDLQDGHQLWKATIDAHHAAHVWSSPTYIDGLILIGSASLELIEKDNYTFRGSIVGLDAANGHEKWRTPVSVTGNTPSGAGVSVWSSFVVDKPRGLAFIGTGQSYLAPASDLEDSLLAVEYATGHIRWHKQFTSGDVFTLFSPAHGPDSDIGATPNLFTVNGVDAVGVGDKAGKYGVFNRETGEPIWPGEPLSAGAAVSPGFKPIGLGSAQGGVMDSAAYSDGVLYIASNNSDHVFFIDGPNENDKHVITAVNAATGATIWRKDRMYPSVGGLAFANGIVFNINTKGIIYAVDASNGNELWSDQMTTENPQTGERKPFIAAAGPSIANGRLYACLGFSFFKTASENTVWGGLISYGLPEAGDTDGGVVLGDAGAPDTTCGTPAGVAACKAKDQQAGLCSQATIDCNCEKCACVIAACEADEGCSKIRACGLRTGCFGPGFGAIQCYQADTCMSVIDQYGGAQGPSARLSVNAAACAFEPNDAGTVCPTGCADGG